jgi:hypothetical protein
MSADRLRVAPRRIGDPESQPQEHVRRPDVASHLLALQRGAGNQAVARALLQRKLSKEWVTRNLDEGAWPNIPVKGAVLAIANRAAVSKTLSGTAGVVLNEIGTKMKGDQRLAVITETLRAHKDDKNFTDEHADKIIRTFKRYLAERTPRADESEWDADFSAREEWKQGLTAPDPDQKDFRYLVSSIDTSKHYGLDRFRNPWLFSIQAVSMSLISPEHPQTYRDFGYIFDVPPECILVAAHDDIGTANTAYDVGAEALQKEVETKLIQADSGIKSAELTARLGPAPESFSGKRYKELKAYARKHGVSTKGSKKKLIARLTQFVTQDAQRRQRERAKIGGGESTLRGPEDVLAQTGRGAHDYNEIYIAGTSLKGDKQVKPSGVFYGAEAFAPAVLEHDKKKREEWAIIQQTAKEFNLPLIAIQQTDVRKTKPLTEDSEEEALVV